MRRGEYLLALSMLGKVLTPRHFDYRGASLIRNSPPPVGSFPGGSLCRIVGTSILEVRREYPCDCHPPWCIAPMTPACPLPTPRSTCRLCARSLRPSGSQPPSFRMAGTSNPTPLRVRSSGMPHPAPPFRFPPDTHPTCAHPTLHCTTHPLHPHSLSLTHIHIHTRSHTLSHTITLSILHTPRATAGNCAVAPNPKP